MTPKPRLSGLATAAPPYCIDQETAAAIAAETFRGKVFRTSDLKTVFANTGIHTRRLARPVEWYATPRSWAERTDAYVEAALELYIEAAGKALAAAGVQARDVGQVVSVSSTGIATPSLDALAHGRLGLSPSVRRTPVFGLGCGGGVSGLALAARLARADPGKPVLLVVVELCSLAYRPDDVSKASIVSSALFGDGAAAAVVVADEGAPGREIGAQAEHLWPDTLDLMGWRIDAAGFGVVLASTLPAFVEANLPPVLTSFFASGGLERAQVDRFVCHPGGTRVLAALEKTLGVGAGALDHERAVLAGYGNMSAPTVFFVLERVLAAGRHAGPLVLSALGPGFTGSLLELRSEHA